MGLVPFSTKEVRTCQVSKKSKLVDTNGYPHGWWGTDTLLFVFFCLSFVCLVVVIVGLLFVLLWLLFVFWLSFGCLVVIVCVLWVAGPGKYGMLGHGPGSPRSRGVVFGTTRKIQEDEDGGRLLIRG